MPGIDYKVSLDASGLNTGLKSISAAQSAMGALSSLMRGDFVGAAVQARNAFLALKAAMMANPFIAVVSAIAAVGAALAAVAWRKHQADIEAVKKATEDLADATERYNKTVRDIAIKRASDTEKLEMLRAERARIDHELDLQRRLLADGKDSPARAIERQAEIKRLETELAIKDEQIREVRERIREAQQKREEELAKAQKEHDAQIAKKEARRDELAKEYERAKSGYSDRDRERDLIAEIAKLEEEAAAPYLGRLSKAEKEIALLEKKIELQRLQNKLAEDEAKKKADAARQLATVRKAEAEYAFSKLSPEQQLAAIHARAREIMGKKGWEKDAEARAELLDLRKRRDELLSQKAKAKDTVDAKKTTPPGETTRTLSDEEAIAVRERLRRARIDDVIRMRGSRAGGFVDDDGVRRMAGSLAGGFSSRLRPSAFARTAAELDAKRKGIATITEERTGQEQPVELKGEAVNYLRIIAGALGKEA